jgi:hypothetical protein
MLRPASGTHWASDETAPAEPQARSATGAGAAGAFPWTRDTTRSGPHSGPSDADRFLIGSVAPSVNDLDVKLRVFPQCGEATLSFAPIAWKERKPLKVDVLTGELFDEPSLWSTLDEDVRQELNAGRSAARSRSRLRRFVVANRLTKMWVVTLAEGLDGEDGYGELVSKLAGFLRRVRRDFFQGRPMPYLWSIEPHPGGHGWHANVLLPQRFIDKRQMQRCWGHGNVWFTDFTKDRTDPFGRPINGKPAASGSAAPARTARAGSRRAAGYVAKYVTKDFGRTDIGDNRHRYDVAQGFQPREVTSRHLTFNGARDTLRAHPAFLSIEHRWSSEDQADWPGWPCEAVWFDSPAVAAKRVKRAKEPAGPEPPR